jgi:hypothetical protein
LDNIAIFSLGKNKLIGSRQSDIKYWPNRDIHTADVGNKMVVVWSIDDHLELGLEETGCEFVWFVN